MFSLLQLRLLNLLFNFVANQNFYFYWRSNARNTIYLLYCGLQIGNNRGNHYDASLYIVISSSTYLILNVATNTQTSISEDSNDELKSSESSLVSDSDSIPLSLRSNEDSCRHWCFIKNILDKLKFRCHCVCMVRLRIPKYYFNAFCESENSFLRFIFLAWLFIPYSN